MFYLKEIYLYFSIGDENGQPKEPALCPLYRHTFVPYYKPNYLVIFGEQITSISKT